MLGSRILPWDERYFATYRGEHVIVVFLCIRDHKTFRTRFQVPWPSAVQVGTSAFAPFPEGHQPSASEAAATIAQLANTTKSCANAEMARCPQWCRDSSDAISGPDFPPDLARVVAAWDRLSAAIKTGILALVQAAGGPNA